MTKVADAPYIYVDGAHNVAAWECLRTSVEKYFTNRRVIYIIGVLKDKEYEKMVEILAPDDGSGSCDHTRYTARPAERDSGIR